MACAELERLHQQASKLEKELKERRRAARAHQAQEEPGQARSHSDYEGYLGRKLQRTAAEIEQHRAQHRCEESC